MDDEDAKIRRNLVVFSAAVLMFAWFDLPFGTVLNKFLGTNIPDTSDNKTLAVAFIVFIYLGLRYRFSSEGRKYSQSIELDRRRYHGQLLKIYAVDVVDQMMAKKNTSSELAEAIAKQLVADQRLIATSMSTLLDKRPKLFIQVGAVDRVDFRTIRVFVTFFLEGKDGPITPTDVQPTATIPVGLAYFFECWSFVTSFLYSGSSIQYLIPVLAANIAVGILTWRALCMNLSW